ncbi:hypothetical protein HY632_02535 [Candidatus Uhrbacteria bacterium]|nr:hypothetical protein [Candidatus Uhrbacteria bacterium]
MIRSDAFEVHLGESLTKDALPDRADAPALLWHGEGEGGLRRLAMRVERDAGAVFVAKEQRGDFFVAAQAIFEHVSCGGGGPVRGKNINGTTRDALRERDPFVGGHLRHQQVSLGIGVCGKERSRGDTRRASLLP